MTAWLLTLVLACPPDTADTADSSTWWTEPTETTETADTADTADTEPLEPLDGPIVIHAVRHGEKEDGDDPGLTEEGAERAEALAVVMVDVPLVAIYATDLRRTQETVQPTADAHGLEIETEIDPEGELVEHLLATHADEEVLHAGHSYTLPDFFEILGLDPVPEVSGYGQLWSITVAEDRTVTVVEGFFGEEEVPG